MTNEPISSRQSTTEAVSSPTEPVVERRFVLVVTDDPHLRDEVQFGFPSDCAVTVVEDARAARETMKWRVPMVAIVDIHTGSAGGYGLRRDMLADDRLRSVPMLMLLDRAHDGWLADQAGATKYLVKPVEVSELVHHALALTTAAAT